MTRKQSESNTDMDQQVSCSKALKKTLSKSRSRAGRKAANTSMKHNQPTQSSRKHAPEKKPNPRRKLKKGKGPAPFGQRRRLNKKSNPRKSGENQKMVEKPAMSSDSLDNQ